MTRKTLVGTALAVLTLGTVLAGCSSNTGHDMTSMTSSATSASRGAQDDHNQADVTFAQAMIPHHSQALDMVKLPEAIRQRSGPDPYSPVCAQTPSRQELKVAEG